MGDNNGKRKKLFKQPGEKRTISDTTIRMLEKHRAPDGLRVYVRDDKINGFAIRLTDKGSLSYVHEARVAIGGRKVYTRRTIGKVGRMTLAAARARAKEWGDQVGAGQDPKEEARKAREAEAAARAITFASVAEEFIKRHLKGQRKAAVAAREIRAELVNNPKLGPKPITRITRVDLVNCLEAIRDRREGGTGAYARNIFSHAKKLFNWAINRGTYGLEHSPLDRINPSELLGKKREREEVLDDDQLRALWRAALREKYPYGDIIRLLMLSGTRLNEAAKARHREFGRELWNIPPERFKMNSVHTVPMTGHLREFYEALPRFKNAKQDFLFTLDGEIPFNGFSRAKQRIDRYMLWKLRALARQDGKDWREIGLKHWQHHDIKRTVRTRLSALGVTEVVAELIAGHSKKGIVRTYDRYKYEKEIREALQKWNELLLSIVEPAPPPTNVVKLKQRGAK